MTRILSHIGKSVFCLILVLTLILTTLPALTPAFAAETDKLTVSYTNIISALHKENGVIVPYTSTANFVKGQTKTLSAKGSLSIAGGANYKVSVMGTTFTFQNVFTVATGDVVNVDTIDLSKTVSKVSYKGNGLIVLTHADGTTSQLEGHELALSPVYAITEAWHLDVNYIDNISTSSGSWTNLGSVSSYRHLFKTPETQEGYSFLYWQDAETQTVYASGDTYECTGAGIAAGTTKEVNIYAWYQPSLTVRYFSGEEEIHSTENFGEIPAYTFIPEDSEYAFGGWIDENGTLVTEDTVYAAPAITTENGTAQTINLTARWLTDVTASVRFDDADNQDGIRPESVAITLMKDGKDLLEATVTAENAYSITFTGLEAGHTYSIREVTPDGYEAQSEDALTIVNTHIPAPVIVPEIEETEPEEPTEEVIPEEIPETENEVPSAPVSGDPEVVEIEEAPSYEPVPMVITEPEEIPEVNEEDLPELPEAVVISSGEDTSSDEDSDEFEEPETEEAEVAEVPENELPRSASPAQEQVSVKAEEIEETEEPEIIALSEEEVPMAAPETHHWALLNLLLLVLAAMTALLETVLFLRGRKAQSEESEEDSRSHRKAKLFTVLPALAAMILFLLTEDLSAKM